MSTRKTTTERIELHKEKMEQMQNEMKELKRKHNAEERKKRNHRICTRGAHLESLLPDTIGLSDTRFYAFLEKTVANKFGRDALAMFVAEQEKEDAAKGTDGVVDSGDTPVEPAAPLRSNAERGTAKPAQTANAPIVADGSRTGATDETGG